MKRWASGRAGLLWLVPGILAVPLLAGEADEKTKSALRYRTPRGVEFVVTDAGLSSIRVGERELVKGGWSAWNAEPWFKGAGSGKVKTKTILEKSIEVLGAERARVRHVKEDVTCVFEYSFAGEDVTISARIENNHATEAMAVTGFSGLQFAFDRPPTGLMQCQHISYFQAHGVGLCHPGHWSKFGGSYATDGTIGVGTSPSKTGWTRTLTLWDYADWNPDKREKLPKRNLLYFVVSAIPPRGAQTLDLKLRVSPERDWKHLLQPYREHFQETFGAVRYKADNRWIATDYLNHSQQAISPQNPYGFHGGHRRIDTADGAKLFCDTLIAPLKDANGQGVIVWGQGGDDPRGGMYRPDFDVMPPEVEANWAALQQRFKDAGQRLGVCTRPRHMAVRDNWKSDAIIDINPDDPGHREMLWKRFKTMMDKGCTLFYLDSFGSSFEDVKLMRYLREKMGPDVLTFCEHQCDAIIPFSGGYSETTLDAEGDPKNAHYGLWSGMENWEIYRWLVPGAQMASRLYQVKGKPPEGFESPERFFYRGHVTPLVPTSDSRRMAPLKAVQPEYVDEKGQWKAE
ncbi:MAG: hypothetical protein NTW87_17850 [Planctomycetota bacterium]|nr:hypothetical protein [Planctomycetota bacterium]